MRVGNIILIAIGLLGACFSLIVLSGTALPYPDPTPEMLQQQSDKVQLWGSSLFVNILLIIIGSWRLWRSRHRN